jgi:hypothetical protein
MSTDNFIGVLRVGGLLPLRVLMFAPLRGCVLWALVLVPFIAMQKRQVQGMKLRIMAIVV